ncbi:hypothetical protein ACFPAF_19690 [Hymenobacter endophyticus]|uniref:DUF4367 domain-containing protein n=1 Tax=Hymenobacter endophyticus TaxID=3076335 RepID=A0ABU3TMP0_9BACT|nr:hypothetical protein [Hymenobacter endophyticus]MDU0372634.1 hypothetical protein [Hymenobacter endophyticus]
MSTVKVYSQDRIDVQDLIDQQITSQIFQKFVNEINEQPEIARFDDVYYYIFKYKGLDFLFDNSDAVKCVFLYSESVDNHRQFQSKLPLGLTFSDTRKDVEKKLGPPDRNDGNGVINFYSVWNRYGITITYKDVSQDNMMNRVNHIALNKR